MLKTFRLRKSDSKTEADRYRRSKITRSQEIRANPAKSYEDLSKMTSLENYIYPANMNHRSSWSVHHSDFGKNSMSFPTSVSTGAIDAQYSFSVHRDTRLNRNASVKVKKSNSKSEKFTQKLMHKLDKRIKKSDNKHVPFSSLPFSTGWFCKNIAKLQK